MSLTKLKIVTVTIFLIILAIPLQLNILEAQEVRHPNNLENIVEEGLNNYNTFLNWLNSTGFIRRFNINVSNVHDILNKSKLILEEVYRNGSLAMFIGGIEFVYLKIFSSNSNTVDKHDIANLLKAVAMKLNITKISISCRNVFTKFFTNVLKPRTCVYNETDIDHLTWYVMSFYRGFPNTDEKLASILSKVYTIKMVLRVGAVYKDVLNNVMDELLYRDSVVLYLILNDAINTNEVEIVTPTQRIPSITTTLTLEQQNKSLKKVITLEDVEKAMKLLTEIMALSKEYGIDITSQDVINIVSYVLSMDIEEALKFLESIDVNAIRSIGRSPSAYNGGSANTSMQVEEGGKPNTFTGSSIAIPRDIYPYEGEYIDEYAREFDYRYHSVNASVGGLGGGKGYAVDIDVALEEVVSSESLSLILEKLSVVPVAIPAMSQAYTLNNSTKTIRRVQTFTIKREEGFGNWLWIYSFCLLLSSLSVALIFKPRIVLNIFSRFSRILRGNSKDFNVKKVRDVFEVFWVLIEKLASTFNVKITASDTHREAYRKIIGKVEDDDLKLKLKDVVIGYEVIRFSNKPYIDVKQWEEKLRSLTHKHS